MRTSKEIVAELFDAKKVEELELLGSEAELCKALNEIYHPFVLSADSYEKLFAAVEAIRKSLLNLKSYPFVNRHAGAAYYLTELEGPKRNMRLGITEAMYDDKFIARQWYKSTAQLVHSDKIGGDPLPMQLLQRLYEKITHEPAPEEE